MSAERGERGERVGVASGGGGDGGLKEREGRRRSERAIQGTCPLSPSEHRGGGEAHMH